MPNKRDFDIVFNYDKETEENLRRIDEMENKYLELYKNKYGHFPISLYIEDRVLAKLKNLKMQLLARSLPIAITLTSKTEGDLSTTNILPYRREDNERSKENHD